MRRTKPRAERRARPHVGRAALHARAEVARAVGARVELGQGVEELQHVRALGRRGGVGIVCGGGVEEGPGRAAERLDVRGAMGGRTPRVVSFPCSCYRRRCGQRCGGGGGDGLRCGVAGALGGATPCRRRRCRLACCRGLPVPEGSADFAGLAVRSKDHAWRERASTRRR